MGKDFLKLKTDQKQLGKILFTGGMVITLILAVRAYYDTRLINGYELQKKEAGEGSYEQEVIARIGKKKIPLTVTVEERKLSEEEAQAELLKAEEGLPGLLKGENESLSKITSDLNFADQVPDTCVEVEWTEKPVDYFHSDGTLRDKIEVSEPTELKVSAILSCREYTKDFETVITLLPQKTTEKDKLLKLIENQNQDSSDYSMMALPKTLDGEIIVWKKSPDVTFLYFFALTMGMVLLLKLGEKRDQREAGKKRLEELEKDYAQIVSKFSMLLSAGLSVRNAWERIVLLYRRRGAEESVVYRELNRGLLEMQKGVSELEVYENFGIRTGQMYYKKLMALFILDRKRGSIHLPDAMNQEMLLAWEEKKRKTRQQGEKTGTKLLIPMMGMLGVVFIMILVPAFLSFQ